MELIRKIKISSLSLAGWSIELRGTGGGGGSVAALRKKKKKKLQRADLFLHTAALKQIEDASLEHESVKSMKMRKRRAAGGG